MKFPKRIGKTILPSLFLMVSCNQSFENINSKNDFNERINPFVHRFISDSNYQKKHLTFPVISIEYDDSNFKNDTIKINENDWKFIDLKDYVEVNNFKLSSNGKHKFVVKMFYDPESGTSVDYYFKKINENWYLYFIDDESI